jgi:hypothetical protein
MTGMSLLESVYILSLVTCIGCAALLARSYVQTGARLLMWSAVCFALLSLNNLLVVVDLIVLPESNLVPLRHAAALSAVSVLLIGFIWEAE